MALTTANRDTALLHPIMRAAAEAVLADCRAAGLPLRIFEAWRSPERQRYLYAQGRTTSGPIVTYAKAWQSYHQYGVAVDFVGHVDGNWTWDLPQSTWNRLHAFGAAHGLERLGFETPHLQVTGLTSGDLMDGEWPDGGDASWRNNLAQAVANWHGEPAAPPIATDEPERPPIVPHDATWSQTPKVGASNWHSKFGGQEWLLDDKGIICAPTLRLLFARPARRSPLRQSWISTVARFRSRHGLRHCARIDRHDDRDRDRLCTTLGFHRTAHFSLGAARPGQRREPAHRR